MKYDWRWLVVYAMLASLTGPADAQPGNPTGLTYKTGWKASIQLGMELYRALSLKYRPFVHSGRSTWKRM